jgi:hypothetical protein
VPGDFLSSAAPRWSHLKYKNGEEEILKLQQSTTAQKTDVVYLSCEATVPRRACNVQLTAPKEQTTK